MKTKFKIGDSVWVARYLPGTPVKVPCSVCFEKRKVTLILGNDDRVELPCDYCGKGNLGVPTGHETEYQAMSKPELITITGVHTEATYEGEKVEYHQNCYVYHEDKVFATKEEALEKGEELKEAHIEEMKQRKDWLKKDVNKSFAWNAGYHLREAKRNEKDMEYHKKKAVLCKERVPKK